MLCFSGFELYSRWVPLTLSVEFAAKSFFPISPETKKNRIHGDECTSATLVDAVFQPYVSMAPPLKVQ